MNKLIELTRTSDSIYYCVVLKKSGSHISVDDLLKVKSISPEGAKLLGTLDSLTEDQAREIIPQPKQGTFVRAVYKTALESLTSLIESKGVNTKENKAAIVKVKL